MPYWRVLARLIRMAQSLNDSVRSSNVHCRRDTYLKKRNILRTMNVSQRLCEYNVWCIEQFVLNEGDSC